LLEVHHAGALRQAHVVEHLRGEAVGVEAVLAREQVELPRQQWVIAQTALVRRANEAVSARQAKHLKNTMCR